MSKKMVTAVCGIMLSLPMAFSSIASAQNRNQNADALFNEPKDPMINQILYTLGDAIAFYVVKPKLPVGNALVAADARAAEIMASALPIEEKNRALEKAYLELAEARVAALKAVQGGAVPTVIRYLRVVGTSLIILDVAGRWWVWGALNANPTWSPVIATLAHDGDRLSRKYAFPEQR